MTKGDALVIALLALATAIAAYYISDGSVGAALLGSLVGAVGGIIPAVVFRYFTKK